MVAVRLAAKDSPAASAKSLRFIGQVTIHLTANALVVWALDAKCAYRAYGVSLSDWPVGSVAECWLADDGAYVGKMTPVDPATREAYKAKLKIR